MGRTTTEDHADDRYVPELKLYKKLALEHLYLLSGSDGALFTFFYIDDRKREPRDPNERQPGYDYRDRDSDPDPAPQSWSGTLDESWPRIERLNRAGAGIFVCIHEMDDSGERDTENFLAVRTCVNDLDHGEPPEPYPVAPSFSVLSSRCGRHDYFLANDISADDYRAVQTVFADKFGGDKQVKDVTRVMRLAGTYHRKTYQPWLVTIEGPNDVPTYTAKELLKAFPPIERKRDKPLKKADDVLTSLTPASDMSADEVISMIEAIPGRRWDDRDFWLMMGQALHHWGRGSEEAFGIWCKAASASDKFDERDSRRVWRSFSEKGSNGEPITVATLAWDDHLAK